LFGNWAFGSDTYPISLYSMGSCFGIAAVLILLLTKLGAAAAPRLLVVARAGLVAGAAVAIAIPEAVSLERRFSEGFNINREVLSTMLPVICYVHFAYLGRVSLFYNREV
jgi:hypothetical protein